MERMDRIIGFAPRPSTAGRPNVDSRYSPEENIAEDNSADWNEAAAGNEAAGLDEYRQAFCQKLQIRLEQVGRWSALRPRRSLLKVPRTRYSSNAWWLVIVAVGLVTTLSAQSVQADFIVSIDLQPDVAGTQSTRSVQQGQQFTVDLMMVYNGFLDLNRYKFRVDFENGVSFVSVSHDFAIGGFDRSGSPIQSGNSIGPFEAAWSSPDTGSTGFELTKVGSITFNAGLVEGDFTITPVNEGSFAPLGVELTPTTLSAVVTITAVPEPSSLLLCVMAGVGLFSRFGRCRSWREAYGLKHPRN